jgi:predicted amidophosphoribosyltransferase
VQFVLWLWFNRRGRKGINMTNNDIYNHNYTKCPLCGEPVSDIDRKCPTCEKNLVQQSNDDEEERIEESKKIIAKLKNIKNEGIKNTLIVQYKKVLNLLIKVKTNLLEYVKSEDFNDL